MTQQIQQINRQISTPVFCPFCNKSRNQLIPFELLRQIARTVTMRPIPVVCETCLDKLDANAGKVQ